MTIRKLSAGLSCVVVSAMPLLAAAEMPVADFYVSTAGNDAWSGTLTVPNHGLTDGPFQTLEKARDALRKSRSSDPVRGGTVAVHGGFYPLSGSLELGVQDSGHAPGAPVVFRAIPGEPVILGGSVELPAEAFTRVPDAGLAERLDPAVRGHVLQAVLGKLGIQTLGSYPVKHDGGPAVPELFFNETRMTLARWPDRGWTHIARIVSTGSDYTGTEPGVFEYSGDRPARWKVEDGVWLHGYWAFDWNAEILQVQAIDLATRQIRFVRQAVYSVKQGNPSPRRYYAFNVIEELDQPGEYFIDRKTGTLYFWPPAPLDGARITLSMLRAPVLSVKQASNLVVHGFTIDATIGNGIEVRDSQAVSIRACQVRNVTDIGIVVTGGTSNTVEACDIHDTGKGGITLSGGDRKTLRPGGHAAVNNHIWRFASHKLTYSDALRLEGGGHRAAHNLIHDSPHEAVHLSGNDHVFEYNIVRNVCTETDDCGALYKGRNPSCRGNIIRYNFWHHIGVHMGHGNAAIYFDDGDGGDRVIGNVFYRCGSHGKTSSFGSVFSHGGHENQAENNIFIECARALGSSPWKDERWISKVKGNENREGWNWADKLLKEVDITRPPYTTRYPELIGFMDPEPGKPRVNRARLNLMVKCGEVSSGSWQYAPHEMCVTNADPGFVNAAAGDFRLKPESAVFKQLPGFQPIPFEKIGLYADILRPVPPREPWPGE